MPSKMVAAGLVALSGMAAAFPQGGFSNTTTGAVMGNDTTPISTTNGTAYDPVTEALFCPNLSGSVIQSRTGVSEYILACATNYFGVVIDVQFNATIFSKRQAPSAPANIQDCLAACETVTGCVGTAFDVDARTCALYSQIGSSFSAPGIDFGIRVAPGTGVEVPAGGTLTSTVYSTDVVTVASCAPTVTDCPLAGGAVVTQVAAVASTEYICPAVTTVPIAPIACQCAYSASTATVYSVSGTTVVPVSTNVVAVPSPSGTDYATTTVAGSAPLTTAPVAATANGNGGAGAGAGSGATATGSSPPTSFTGGASNVQAGMGLIAGVAGLAFML